jgi:hypothetical protein
MASKVLSVDLPALGLWRETGKRGSKKSLLSWRTTTVTFAVPEDAPGAGVTPGPFFVGENDAFLRRMDALVELGGRVFEMEGDGWMQSGVVVVMTARELRDRLADSDDHRLGAVELEVKEEKKEDEISQEEEPIRAQLDRISSELSRSEPPVVRRKLALDSLDDDTRVLCLDGINVSMIGAGSSELVVDVYTPERFFQLFEPMPEGETAPTRRRYS